MNPLVTLVKEYFIIERDGIGIVSKISIWVIATILSDLARD